MLLLKPHLLCISMISICLLCATTLSANTTDPLTLSEISKVTRLVSPTPTIQSGSLLKPSLKRINSSDKKQNKEILLVERHIEEKNAPKTLRRADIYTYDYATNELIEALVDLNTNEIISSERRQGVQLPLTNNELARAKEIVFEDEEERQILQYEYQRITSRVMTDTSDLNIKAFTFKADSLPNRVNEASKLCGIHRCAQLMLYTAENIVFEVSPIVNLSEGIVTQRIGF